MMLEWKLQMKIPSSIIILPIKSIHSFYISKAFLPFFFLFISISETKVNQHSYSQIWSKADQFRSIFALASALYISNLPTSKILYHISQHGRISRGREKYSSF